MAPTRLVDTHAHLDDERLRDDLNEVLARARAAGVEQIVAIGTTIDDSAAVVRLAQEYNEVFAAVGIHPNNSAEAAADDWERIVQLAAQAGVVALGETGLDKHWDRAPFALQQEYFDRHLRLSQATGLPAVIHTRDCLNDAIGMLREAHRRGPVAGVMHSYTGDADAAAECVALGLYVSFAGMVTFKKSDELRAVAATIPAGRILVETDSPYLSPEPLRGKRNEPANVLHTARCIAEVRGAAFEDFAAQTRANARQLFKLP